MIARITHRLARSKGLALLAAAAGIGLSGAAVHAAAALWISAPNWSYSAAAAESPAGWAYFWGLSSGAGTYSFAYAFSNDGNGNAAYAYAAASAGGLGGQGAVQVAGLADPYSGVSVDLPLVDPSQNSGYPTSKPPTDPFTQAYTVSNTGITFTSEASSQLNGTDGLQAFTYSGGTDLASLEAALGASSSGGTSQAGDVTSLPQLSTDLGLIPLDPLITDTNNATTLSFTENTSNLNTSNVILVGTEQTPEPASLALLAIGGLGVLMRRKRSAA
ncbi:MAG: PEP-CTERM sorting domain-containing protein [Phycisphaerae bacterium]